MKRTAASEAFFGEFRAARSVVSHDYDLVAFGNSEAMSEQLVALVERGIKRATASLRRDYAEGRSPLPRVGDHVVVVDSKGVPRVIWRMIEI